MTERKPTLVELLLGFTQIGLSSIGGAAAILRYVIVTKRRWMSEAEFSETFGLAQALPGATGANVTAMVSDRFGGWRGVLIGLAGLCVPSMLLAIGLLSLSTRLSATNPRFAAAETAVTAAVAGLFIGNGIRVSWSLWTAKPGDRRRWRAARLGIVGGAIVLIDVLHVWIPAVVLILASLSGVSEWRSGRAAQGGPE